MKYIEEIYSGDCFEFKNKQYLLTHDFKKNGQRLCYCLLDGTGEWFEPSVMVEIFPIYGLDNNNNTYPIKPTPKSSDVI
jgi:hypothetical protein